VSGHTAHDLADAAELGPALMAKLKPSAELGASPQSRVLSRKRKAAADLSPAADASRAAAANGMTKDRDVAHAAVRTAA